MPRRGSPYGRHHQRERARMLAGRPLCHWCGALATEADHDPPLSRHHHVNESGCCRLLPACGPCQRGQARMLMLETMGRHPSTKPWRSPPEPSRVW